VNDRRYTGFETLWGCLRSKNNGKTNSKTKSKNKTTTRLGEGEGLGEGEPENRNLDTPVQAQPLKTAVERAQDLISSGRVNFINPAPHASAPASPSPMQVVPLPPDSDIRDYRVVPLTGPIQPPAHLGTPIPTDITPARKVYRWHLDHGCWMYRGKIWSAKATGGMNESPGIGDPTMTGRPRSPWGIKVVNTAWQLYRDDYPAINGRRPALSWDTLHPSLKLFYINKAISQLEGDHD